LFTRQLVALLKAGMLLSTALKTLAHQTKNKKVSAIIEQLHDDIEGSLSLSEAMAKHPRAFPSVYAAVVSAAEESGTLVETLTTISKHLRAQASVMSRIRSALTYPVFLLILGGGVVGALVSFVIPKFVSLFINANQELPLITRLLINTVESAKQWWWTLLLIPLALVIIFIILLQQAHFRRSVDSLLLKLPLLGALNLKLQMARFARTLGSLLHGGVRIISALEIVSQTTANKIISQEINNIAEGIAKGSTLAKAIDNQEHFSSEILTSMISVGEESGELPEMLFEVADIYAEESESIITTLTNLLGPVMIIFLGILIGFVVLAILLPIFETSTIIT